MRDEFNSLEKSKPSDNKRKNILVHVFKSKIQYSFKLHRLECKSKIIYAEFRDKKRWILIAKSKVI